MMWLRVLLTSNSWNSIQLKYVMTYLGWIMMWQDTLLSKTIWLKHFSAFPYVQVFLRWQIVPDCYLKTKFRGQRPPQFVVARGHNIWEVTESLSVAGGQHSSLWPTATTFGKLQFRDNLVTLRIPHIWWIDCSNIPRSQSFISSIYLIYTLLNSSRLLTHGSWIMLSHPRPAIVVRGS